MRRMSPARRGPSVVVVVVAAVVGGGSLALAGCTASDPGSPAPTTLHPGTAAAPTTSTPSGNPTDLAAAAAVAAVERLYLELNRAIATGETAQYRRTYTPACVICVHDARVTEQIYGKGQRVVGGTYHLTHLTVVWNKPDLVVVQGKLSADALTVRSKVGVVARNAALKPFAFAWDVRPVAGVWLVSSVQALK